MPGLYPAFEGPLRSPFSAVEGFGQSGNKLNRFIRHYVVLLQLACD
jgi:hypothetical protein